MSRDNPVEVGMAGLGKYATNPDSSNLRDEVNDYLRENIGTDVGAVARITDEMTKAGLIGDIALAEFDRIDGIGGRGKDGSIDADEIRLAGAPGSDPTTILAANFLKRNAADVMGVDNHTTDFMQWGINPLHWSIGGWGPGVLFPDKIEEGELRTYQSNKSQETTGLLSDTTGFGNYEDFNAFTDDGGSAPEKDGSPDPDDTFNSKMSVTKLKSAFADPDSSAEQRLQAAMALHEKGEDSFTIEDKDGRELNISIKTKEGGQISLWVKGFANPLMRGFVRDGKVSQQGDLGYYGDNWSKKYGEDDTFFR